MSIDLLKRNEIATLIAPLGFTEQQTDELNNFLQQKGFITKEDLENELVNRGLTDAQIKSLQPMLNKFVTGEDARQIAQGELTAAAATFQMIQTETAIPASTATAIAAKTAIALAECYIKPDPNISSVAVRNEPDKTNNHNVLGYIFAGQVLHVVAHNGGRIGQDLWWVVEFPLNGELRDGWVLSSVVEEINTEACLRLPKARGS